MKILAINPGSTSTKMGVFLEEKPLLIKSIPYTPDDLAPFDPEGFVDALLG